MERMILTLPNVLTIGRIAAIPIIVALFFVDGRIAPWVACVIFTAAGLTDFLDGYLARAMASESRLGRLLDPIADKLLVGAVLLMVVGTGGMSTLTYIPAVVILCREILVSGLREHLAELNVSLPVTRLAKWKTVGQMVAIGFLIVGEAGPVFFAPLRDHGADRRDSAVERGGAHPGDRLGLPQGGFAPRGLRQRQRGRSPAAQRQVPASGGLSDRRFSIPDRCRIIRKKRQSVG